MSADNEPCGFEYGGVEYDTYEEVEEAMIEAETSTREVQRAELTVVPDLDDDDTDEPPAQDDDDWTDEQTVDGLAITMVDAEAYEDNDTGRGLMMLDMLGDQVYGLTDARGEFVLWRNQWWHRYTAEQMFTAAWGSTVPVAMREAAIRHQVLADEAKATGEDADAHEKRAKLFAQRAVAAGNELQMSKGVAHAWRSATTPPDGRQARSRRSWDFDNDSNLIGADNGVIDIGAYCASGDLGDLLRPAQREDMVTTSIGYDFDPTAFSQTVAKHLELFMSASEDLRRDTFMVLGDLTMVGNGRRIMPFLKGASSTGKSATAELTDKALGAYAATVKATEVFRDKKGPRPELTKALPRRGIVMSEVGSHATLHSDMIKSLTSQDIQAARNLYSNDITEDAARFTPLIATNSMPQISGADDDSGAMFRRLLVIPFEQEHPDLGAKIEYDDAARSHWLRLMIDGRRDSYLWAREHGHDWTRAAELCTAIADATNAAIGDLDPLRAWCNETFVVDLKAPTSERVGTKEVWDKYNAHHNAEGTPIADRITSSQKLARKLAGIFGATESVDKRRVFKTPIVLRGNTESE